MVEDNKDLKCFIVWREGKSLGGKGYPSYGNFDEMEE